MTTCSSLLLVCSALGPAVTAGPGSVGTTLPVGPYAVAQEPWPEELGNHRVRLRVTSDSETVHAHIPWRRRDQAPEEKGLLLIAARSGERVRNLVPVRIERADADIIFEPTDGPGEYFLYYLPFSAQEGHVGHTTSYMRPEATADPEWLERHRLAVFDAEEVIRDVPKAQVLALEARRECDRFDPMEVIASPREVDLLLLKHPHADYIVFAEDCSLPIRMKHDIPARWIEMGAGHSFTGTAQPGEHYAFQLGLFAARGSVDTARLAFGDLIGPSGRIPASGYRCINLEGVNWRGEAFKRDVHVDAGCVQPLWVLLDVPPETEPGHYAGGLEVRPEGRGPWPVTINLEVTAEPIEENGDNEPWRHSRLHWLDSQIGLDRETSAPFPALEVAGREITCLGRSVRIGQSGLPESVRSFFDETVTAVGGQPEELLADALRFVVDTEAGPLEWQYQGLQFPERAPGAVSWQIAWASDLLLALCEATMEYDGTLDYRVSLHGREDVDVSDIRLEIPLRRRVAQYMMGMGRPGGERPERWDWTWDQQRLQDSVWLGKANAGLRCQLYGGNYEQPLINIYYHLKPLNLPRSWHNEGKGGCTIEETEFDTVTVRAHSGPRRVKPFEHLQFNFRLHVTPFKPLDPAHFGQRYYHAHRPVEEIAATGANIVNIHHATPINPYINYPFLRAAELAEYVEQGHEQGLKVKIYYTVRELSNFVTELWALRSLGHEVFAPGAGRGDSWLCEHLGGDFIGAWRQRLPSGEVDAALITSGMSRWHNYYLEGLSWLLRHVEIDGLYIDDVAYDRVVMQRARKILDRERPGSLIDLHSWNHFNARAGFASCANLYMEHFPYIDSLWFGEGFDYDAPPDYWLVEMSGIPYGLFGEMLQDGGNPHRGMLYGATTRLPYSGDPRPLWELFDEFGIEQADMIGYWVSWCPVSTSHDDVLATVYRRPERCLVALASWAPEAAECELRIDWDAVGMTPETAVLRAPALEGLQEERVFGPNEAIPVEPGRGWLLYLEPKAE